MTTSHASHDHEATSAARAACRKARQDRLIAASELIGVLAQGYQCSGGWLSLGASRFAGVDEGSDIDKALALLAHFAPSGDDDIDRGRRANGYVITASASEIRSIICRSAS